MNYFRSLIVAIFLSSCAFSESKDNNELPNYDAVEIISLANAYLKESENIDLQRYRLESIGFSFGKRRWDLFYVAYDLAIGGHFLLYISEDKQKIEIVPGI